MIPADLIASLEGFRTHAYPDPATGGFPWTIGYGHTGRGVGPGTEWTPEQCRAQLEHDCVAFGQVVDDLVEVPIPDSARAALVSFAFNEGSHRVTDPMCRVIPLLNSGDYLSAAGQFMHWTAAGGVHGFLKARRMREVEVFLSDLGVL